MEEGENGKTWKMRRRKWEEGEDGKKVKIG